MASSGSRTYLFFSIVLGSRPGSPAGKPVLAAIADGVVQRRRGDAAVDLFRQLFEGVLYRGLGHAGDPAAQAAALRAAAHSDLAAPSSRAPAVPVIVFAWAVMLEVNCVVAFAAPFRHAPTIAAAGG
jgi:hypothetical protein